MLGGGEEVAAGRAAATRSSGCWGAVEAWRTGAPGGASWGGGDVGGVRAFVGTGARPMPVKASAPAANARVSFFMIASPFGCLQRDPARTIYNTG